MRWFAKRWLHDELLELEDGTTLHYPHNFTGPGYILRDEESRRLEGYVSLGAWAFIGNFVVFFGPPKNLLESWLVGLAGNSFLGWLLVVGLACGAILLSSWLVRRRIESFLELLDRRDATFWEEDLKRLAAAAENTKPRSFFSAIFILLAIGLGLGLALDTVLMLVLWE